MRFEFDQWPAQGSSLGRIGFQDNDRSHDQ
jgi:hypothetical protein